MTENPKINETPRQNTQGNVTPEREHLSKVGHKGGEARTGKQADQQKDKQDQNQQIADADQELGEGNRVNENLKRKPV